MPLTESLCRKALPREKNYKLTDGDGLYLLIQTNGMRYWRMNYRQGGKQRTAVFGAYPEVSLNDARIRTFDLRRQLKEGKATAAANRDTFEVVAREWFALRKPAWKPSHHERVGARVERDLIAPLGDMAIADITAPKLLAVLREVEARGAMDIAKRVRQHADQIFTYALVTGRVERNVAADLRGAMAASSRVKHLAALREQDLPGFFHRLRNYDGDEQTRLAVEFVVHTFVRTNEMRFARWSEIEGDLWRIPAERMKMQREHIVPLPPRSQAILRRLRELADGSEWVAPGRKDRPMSQNTMIFALYRMGYHSRATMHGFRATASTILNERGFAPDWIERQLAHVPGNKVRSAYNAAEYLPGRRKMMDWWSDDLDQQATMASVML